MWQRHHKSSTRHERQTHGTAECRAWPAGSGVPRLGDSLASAASLPTCIVGAEAARTTVPARRPAFTTASPVGGIADAVATADAVPRAPPAPPAPTDPSISGVARTRVAGRPFPEALPSTAAAAVAVAPPGARAVIDPALAIGGRRAPSTAGAPRSAARAPVPGPAPAPVPAPLGASARRGGAPPATPAPATRNR